MKYAKKYGIATALQYIVYHMVLATWYTRIVSSMSYTMYRARQSLIRRPNAKHIMGMEELRTLVTSRNTPFRIWVRWLRRIGLRPLSKDAPSKNSSHLGSSRQHPSPGDLLYHHLLFPTQAQPVLDRSTYRWSRAGTPRPGKPTCLTTGGCRV